MSSKMLAVRIPETMHRYIRHKAVINDQTIQQVVCEIFTRHQMADADYMSALDELATDALHKLATCEGEHHAP